MLFYSSSGEPVAFPIAFIQVTDDDSLTAAGMDKFVVLQVNTDVIGSASRTLSMKKDEVAFLQLPFADASAVLLSCPSLERCSLTLYTLLYRAAVSPEQSTPLRLLPPLR